MTQNQKKKSNKIFISFSNKKIKDLNYAGKYSKKYLTSLNNIEEDENFLYSFYKIDQSKINKISILNQIKNNDFKFENDFSAFILFKKTGKTFFIRDKFGQIPIYYFKNKDYFIITDDPRLINQYNILTIEPDLYQNALFVGSHYRYHYLSNHCSFYKNIKTLRSGYLVELFNNKLKTKQYWKLKIINGNDEKKSDYIYDRFKTLLSNSIQKKINKNAKNIFTLSSGIDSSSVISLFHYLNKKKVHSVTTTFNEDTEYDETLDIKSIKTQKCSKWSKTVISKNDVLTHMNKYLKYSPVPFCTITQLLHGILLEKIKKKKDANFCISGLGGDEVNCGEIEEYIFFFADLINFYDENHNSIFFKKNLDGWIKNHGTNEYPKSYKILLKEFDRFLNKKKGSNKIPSDRYFSYRNAFNKDFAKKYFKKYKLPNIYKKHLHNKLSQDLFIEAIPPALYAEYYNSQYYNIPTLRPYLEKNIMEFGISAPHYFKYKNGVTKNIARKALKDILPNDVIKNKKKIGWNAPFDLWLRESIKTKVELIINSDDKRINKIYNKKFISNCLNEHLIGKKNHMLFFWNLINYENWYSINF